MLRENGEQQPAKITEHMISKLEDYSNKNRKVNGCSQRGIMLQPKRLVWLG